MFAGAKKKTKVSVKKSDKWKEVLEHIDPKGMKCPKCKKPGGMKAQCLMLLSVPLAKGGGVKLAGIPIGHAQVKEHWEKNKPKAVVCIVCGAKFEYVEGDGLKSTDEE